jgi:YVTN family beta-propeller protein
MQLKFKKIVGYFFVCLFVFAFLFVGLVQAANTSIVVTVGGSPCALAVTPDGKYVYVPTGQSVAVIDTSTNKLVTSIKTGRSCGVAVTPDGEYVYVLNGIPANTDSGASVSVISVSSNKVVSTIMVDGAPEDVAITPNGKYVYVLSTKFVLVDTVLSIRKAFGFVSVIDIATEDVVATVQAGVASCAVAITSDGECVYVANSDGTLSVIDSSFNVETKSIAAENVTLSNMAISSDDKYLYVVTWDEVLVVSVANYDVVATVTGFGAPSGVAVTPDGKYVYVTEGWNDAVSVISTAKNVVEYYASAGTSPKAVVIAPNGKYAYVTNLAGRVIDDGTGINIEHVGTVSVISTDPKLVTTVVPSRVPDSVNNGDSLINIGPNTDIPTASHPIVSLQSLLVVVVLCVVVVVVVFLVVMRIRRKPKVSFLTTDLGVKKQSCVCLTNFKTSFFV